MLRRFVFTLSLTLSLASSVSPSLAWAEEPPVAPAPAPPPPPARDVRDVNQPDLVAPTTAPGVPTSEGSRLAEPEIPRSEPPELGGEDLNLGWTLARTMLVLAMVIGLAWLTLNVGLRRLLGIRPTVGTHLVSVLERVPLDQKRSLFVIEAAGEILLVGGGDGALSLIAKLDRAEVDKLRTASPSQPIQLSPFLQKLLGRKDSAPPTPPPAT